MSLDSIYGFSSMRPQSQEDVEAQKMRAYHSVPVERRLEVSEKLPPGSGFKDVLRVLCGGQA